MAGEILYKESTQISLRGLRLYPVLLQIQQFQAAMYEMLTYLWFLFMAGLIVATVVAIVMSQPKRAPKSAVASDDAVQEPVNEAEPVLDFGDELAQMDQK